MDPHPTPPHPKQSLTVLKSLTKLTVKVAYKVNCEVKKLLKC